MSYNILKFSKSERNGIGLLLILLVLIWGFRFVYPKLVSQPTANFEEFEKAIQHFEETNTDRTDNSPKNYQQSASMGGVGEEKHWSNEKAKEKEVKEEEVVAKPSFAAKQNNKPNKAKKTYTKYKKKAAFSGILDLNQADTTALKQLKGIGSSYAKRIVKYRELLGGFVKLEQLNEVYGLQPETYEMIAPHLKIKEGFQPQQININEAEFKALVRHPYIEYELAKSIANARRGRPFESTKELLALLEVGEALYAKLSPYIKV